MDIQALKAAYGGDGNADDFFQMAQEFERENQPHMATTAYDRAFGLAPERGYIVEARQKLLNELAITEHGIHFRYIPAGTFLMGSENGDPDERPVHPVYLDAYWMSETPISWAKFCEIMEFLPPPQGYLPDDGHKSFPKRIVDTLASFGLIIGTDTSWIKTLQAVRQICLQYCESETLFGKHNWHNHHPEFNPEFVALPDHVPEEIVKQIRLASSRPQRADNEAPYTYDQKPMVSVDYHAAIAMASKLSGSGVSYRLPTEAEWEKAARGGLIGAKYAWGNQAPSQEICDFERFNDFSIRKSKQFPPNAYGMYAMCGGVWEWVMDRYDAQYYATSPRDNPKGSKQGEEYVLRGGSWADDADAVTVCYRSSSAHGGAANIGFRLCRVVG